MKRAEDLTGRPSESAGAIGLPRPEWVMLKQPSMARRRLACFPFAGGGVSLYRPWASEVAPDVELVSLLLPGREQRLLEPPLTDLVQVAQLAALAMQQLRPLPTVFFGHSMGALLAYESLRASADTIACICLAVSGSSAPGFPRAIRRVGEMTDSMFIDYLGSMGGTPREVLEQPEMMELLLPMLRADFGMVDDYRPCTNRQPLTCPLLAFQGSDDPATSTEGVAAWADVTRGSSVAKSLPGGHFFISEQVGPILRALSIA